MTALTPFFFVPVAGIALVVIVTTTCAAFRHGCANRAELRAMGGGK